jgi:hypothetical protein
VYVHRTELALTTIWPVSSVSSAVLKFKDPATLRVRLYVSAVSGLCLSSLYLSEML